MTEAALHRPARPRSLWSDAWARLKADRAAYWSGFFILGMIIACLVGPFLTGHAFNTIYQDPSLPWWGARSRTQCGAPG